MTLALSETDTQTASLQRELPQQQAAVPLLRPLHRHALILELVSLFKSMAAWS